MRALAERQRPRDGRAGIVGAAEVSPTLAAARAGKRILLANKEALVMGGALGVAAIGFRVVLRRAAPRFGDRFHLSAVRAIDAPLLGGAALFGIGWGLAGYCPGPAIASLGYTGRQGEHMVALENTPQRHHMVVCTLCSCYPWPVLGLPPTWYKSAPYHSRAVKDPRGVLADFGVTLPESTEIRIVDSTAEVRYLVLPMRPAGTEGFKLHRPTAADDAGRRAGGTHARLAAGRAAPAPAVGRHSDVEGARAGIVERQAARRGTTSACRRRLRTAAPTAVAGLREGQRAIGRAAHGVGQCHRLAGPALGTGVSITSGAATRVECHRHGAGAGVDRGLSMNCAAGACQQSACSY